MRRGKGKAELEEGLKWSGLVGAKKIEQLLWCGAEPLVDVEGEREEDHQRSGNDDCRVAPPEPNHHDRGEGKHRQTLDGDEKGLQEKARGFESYHRPS